MRAAYMITVALCLHQTEAGLSNLVSSHIRNKRGSKDPIERWDTPSIATMNGHANVTLDEGTTGNTSIKVQTTPEAVSFDIESQDTPAVFSIDTESGLLSIKDDTDIDFESGPKFYVIVITAVAQDDSTATATTTIRINDVNDEAPKFSSQLYAVRIEETAKPGAGVIGLTVTDADLNPSHRSVTLTISDGDPDNLFTIRDDGIIRVGEGKNLYNTTPLYLTVKATDGKQESTTHVIIGICSITSGGNVVISTRFIFYVLFVCFISLF